jgi:hypothetical protein
VLLVLCVSAAFAQPRDEVIPAGTLLQCTLSEPNFSSKTAAVGDPVLCHLGSMAEFGRPLFPRGGYTPLTNGLRNGNIAMGLTTAIYLIKEFSPELKRNFPVGFELESNSSSGFTQEVLSQKR